MEAAGRSRRSKKVSAKMSVVSEEDKRQAVQARLDALENDYAEEAYNVAGSDDEFQLEESDEGEHSTAAQHAPAVDERRNQCNKV